MVGCHLHQKFISRKFVGHLLCLDISCIKGFFVCPPYKNQDLLLYICNNWYLFSAEIHTYHFQFFIIPVVCNPGQVKHLKSFQDIFWLTIIYYNNLLKVVYNLKHIFWQLFSDNFLFWHLLHSSSFNYNTKSLINICIIGYYANMNLSPVDPTKP